MNRTLVLGTAAAALGALFTAGDAFAKGRKGGNGADAQVLELTRPAESPDSDAVGAVQYWDTRRDELARRYERTYENQYFEIFRSREG